MLEQAKLMVSLGLVDAGYNFMNIDDCWAEKNRSADGSVVAGMHDSSPQRSSVSYVDVYERLQMRNASRAG